MLVRWFEYTVAKTYFVGAAGEYVESLFLQMIISSAHLLAAFGVWRSEAQNKIVGKC